MKKKELRVCSLDFWVNFTALDSNHVAQRLLRFLDTSGRRKIVARLETIIAILLDSLENDSASSCSKSSTHQQSASLLVEEVTSGTGREVPTANHQIQKDAHTTKNPPALTKLTDCESTLNHSIMPHATISITDKSKSEVINPFKSNAREARAIVTEMKKFTAPSGASKVGQRRSISHKTSSKGLANITGTDLQSVAAIGGLGKKSSLPTSLKSEVQGVYFDKYMSSWIAMICYNRRRQKRTFSCKKYGTAEAKQLAEETAKQLLIQANIARKERKKLIDQIDGLPYSDEKESLDEFT